MTGTRGLPPYKIEYDHEYTGLLHERLREKLGSGGPRNATHASDLLYCLRKGHARLRAAALADASDTTEELDDDTILTFLGGLQFEALVAEGEKGRSTAYCFQCHALSTMPNRQPNSPEQDICPVCERRWLVFTPDWVSEGIVHESKQTRKSRRRGPEDAPWWIEQLATYVLVRELGGKSKARWGRLVINWLMGDYGSRKKGLKPVPPRSAIDAYKVIFEIEEGDGAGRGMSGWLSELHRRKGQVEGAEMPALTGMDPKARSPAYAFECSSCAVGLEIDCERYIWTADGREKGHEEPAVEPEKEVEEEVET